MHGGFTRWVMEHGDHTIPDSKLVGLPRCGHMVQMDCAGEFNDVVLQFLNRQDVAPMSARR
jgi:pimeloyl-ACP methyl ester carboxylesterase